MSLLVRLVLFLAFSLVRRETWPCCKFICPGNTISNSPKYILSPVPEKHIWETFLHALLKPRQHTQSNSIIILDYTYAIGIFCPKSQGDKDTYCFQCTTHHSDRICIPLFKKKKFVYIIRKLLWKVPHSFCFETPLYEDHQQKKNSEKRHPRYIIPPFSAPTTLNSLSAKTHPFPPPHRPRYMFFLVVTNFIVAIWLSFVGVANCRAPWNKTWL